jgi:L(+)-tartrate dehydratase beta subunit
LALDPTVNSENVKIASGIEKLHAGTRPAKMRRYGETDDKTQDVI